MICIGRKVRIKAGRHAGRIGTVIDSIRTNWHVRLSKTETEFPITWYFHESELEEYPDEHRPSAISLP